jgi:hypothetical protein
VSRELLRIPSENISELYGAGEYGETRQPLRPAGPRLQRSFAVEGARPSNLGKAPGRQSGTSPFVASGGQWSGRSASSWRAHSHRCGPSSQDEGTSRGPSPSSGIGDTARVKTETVEREP